MEISLKINEYNRKYMEFPNGNEEKAKRAFKILAKEALFEIDSNDDSFELNADIRTNYEYDQRMTDHSFSFSGGGIQRAEQALSTLIERVLFEHFAHEM